MLLLLALVMCAFSCRRARPATRTAPSDAKPPTTLDSFERRVRYPVLTPAILASISDDALEMAVIDHIYDVVIGEDWDHELEIVRRLNPGMRMMFATFALEGEVNNGGFNQFFWNSSGQFADEAVAGLRLIGAHDHAELTQRAIEIHAAEEATLRAFKERGTVEAFSESYEHSKLDPLDERFFELPSLTPRRTAYIRAHPDQFTSP